MSWFKNPWDKGGSSYPTFLDKEPSALSGASNLDKRFTFDRNIPRIFEVKVGDSYYYMSFPTSGDNFTSTDLRVDLLKAGSDDDVTDSFLKTIYSQKVPAFIGDTLEIDDEHTKSDSPFTEPLLNSSNKKFKVDKQVISSLEVIKAVLKANTDKLSIVIIGNHENVTEGNIYKTGEDKKNNVKLPITLSDFMKQRAEIYQTTFFSGISNVVTMGANDERNVYADDHNTSIPTNARKFLKPGANLEGISVVFLLKGAPASVRHE